MQTFLLKDYLIYNIISYAKQVSKVFLKKPLRNFMKMNTESALPAHKTAKINALNSAKIGINH